MIRDDRSSDLLRLQRNAPLHVIQRAWSQFLSQWMPPSTSKACRTPSRLSIPRSATQLRQAGEAAKSLVGLSSGRVVVGLHNGLQQESRPGGRLE